MPTPSLLIVPARFKTGRLYSQIPVPVAPSTSSVGDFNVTRATVATRVNASGLIESVASGIPRLDYFASGGVVGCPALLVEPAATNTLSGSVNFTSAWSESAVSSASGITSPSGSTNAVLYEAQSTTARVRQVATLASGSTYTFSCFGKFGALSSGFSMNVFDENATSYGSGVCQAFNLNEGTLGSSGTVGTGFTLQSVGMEDYGSGWYRCRMTVLMGYTPAAPRVGFRIGTAISGRPTSVVSGTVNVWGAQLETGSVATSYIPTTTAAITRNAEVISVSGAVSGSIGQTEGTVYVEVNLRNLNTSVVRRLLTISDGTTSNLFQIFTNDSSSIVNLASTASGYTTLSSPNAVVGIAKIAFAYALNDVAFYINGTLIGTRTPSTIPACNTFTLGARVDGFGVFNDHIRAAALYTTRLTNDQLAALTTL